MGVSLSMQDMGDLKAKGFSDAEIQEAVMELEKEELDGSYRNTQNQYANDPRVNSKQSSFMTRPESDMARWQLELNDILERIEHILKGDQPKFKDGHVIWEDNPDKKTNTLNEKGVREILKMLSFYVNRNTILSDYEDDEIRVILFGFGSRLNNLIFMKYDEYGMEDEEKRKEFEMIVGAIVDIVYSAYKRAKHGGERRSIREMVSIQHSSQIGSSTTPDGRVIINAGGGNKERGLLNPMRYIRGKYK
jgi:hypothetical protein